jgi:hypothetical protein
MSSKHSTILAAAAMLIAGPAAFAGTVITTNLPAGDTIVNIGGTTDGAATSSGPNQDLWYQPFNSTNSLLEVTLQPGTYAFRLIDSTDAASMFPSLTGSQLAEIGGGAWTFNSPWTTDYMVFDSSAASNPNEPQLFSGAINSSGTTFGSAAAAYSAAISGGYFDQIVINGGRYTGTTVNQFTISGSPETLIFAVPDYFLPDNNGIDSVLISPASSAPEPSSLWFVALALIIYSAKTLWTNCTAIDPSPTAAATRFMLPDRTSPTAKTPGRLVSSR